MDERREEEWSRTAQWTLRREGSFWRGIGAGGNVWGKLSTGQKKQQGIGWMLMATKRRRAAQSGSLFPIVAFSSTKLEAIHQIFVRPPSFVPSRMWRRPKQQSEAKAASFV
jgi:hypothetical protein